MPIVTIKNSNGNVTKKFALGAPLKYKGISTPPNWPWPEMPQKLIDEGYTCEMVPDPVVPFVPTPLHVKNAAHRRIIEILPEWKQRNTSARGLEIVVLGLLRLSDHLGYQIFTDEEIAEIVGGQEVWATIKFIREKSDEIESMDPIPADFDDNTRWEKTA